MNSKPQYIPVDDVKSIRYKCSFCASLLREPMQAPCAHFFCKTCLGALVSDNKLKCPQDAVIFTRAEVFPDAYVRNEIRGIEVHCLEFKAGCLWQGKLKDVKVHLSSCEYVKVRCENTECSALVMRCELQDHQQNLCLQRQVDCTLCEESVVFCKMEDHQLQVCPFFPIECESCKKQFPRKLLSQHISEECPEAKSFCPFLAIGCSEDQEMKRFPRKQHEESTIYFHLALLLQFAIGLKDDIGRIASDMSLLRDAGLVWEKTMHAVSQLVTQMGALAEDNGQVQVLVRDFQTRLSIVEEKSAVEISPTNPGAVQAQMQRLASVVNDVLRKISNVEAKEENHELLLVEANQTIQEQRKEKEKLKRDLADSREEARALERRVRVLEERVKTVSTPLVLQPSSYDGTLLWKISDVAEKQNDAITGRQTSIFSPDFYTSRYGYRMSVRLYLNGDGMGRGSHVSVFFIIKRSEQDALLRWPFRQKVTIMLLDQDLGDHVIDAFRPDPNSSSFQRPRREANIASGCPLFCPLSLLEKRGYVRDDTMFMKIVVDCQDL